MAGRGGENQQPVVHFGPRSRSVDVVGPLPGNEPEALVCYCNGVKMVDHRSHNGLKLVKMTSF